MLNWKTLARRWGLDVTHGHYRETGDWYHHLTRFPGALFDKHGYVVFATEADYLTCPQLQLAQDVHVPNGIASIPKYVRVVGADGERLDESKPDSERMRYREGQVVEVNLTRYERDRAARQACLEHHGFNCSVCQVNLEDKYGPAAEGVVHVHHLAALGDAGGEYEVDPIADLRPVCPNCHAVIHSKHPHYSIAEVRTMLEGLPLSSPVGWAE